MEGRKEGRHFIAIVAVADSTQGDFLCRMACWLATRSANKNSLPIPIWAISISIPYWCLPAPLLHFSPVSNLGWGVGPSRRPSTLSSVVVTPIRLRLMQWRPRAVAAI